MIDEVGSLVGREDGEESDEAEEERLRERE